jgi:hypothetical protein
MKTILQILKKHPVSVICYLLYFALFILEVLRQLEYHRILDQNNGNWPYAHREWVGVFLFLFGFIFLTTTLIVGAFKREGSGFYIWLCLAIILPMVIYGNI